MNIIKFTLSVGVCFLVAIVGSIVTTPAISTWYTTLNKPVFNPPNSLFAPVWTVLFLLMGISLYLVWAKKAKAEKKKLAVELFFAQLIFNYLWSLLFFGLYSPILAFVDIILLWIAILVTIIKFYDLSKTAAYLLIPYLVWVSFAAILNYSIIILNR